jgi:hypothetical protein
MFGASRMSIEEVAKELRNEGVWYNGFDWLERRRNGRREREARERAAQKKHKYEGDDSSSSSKSDDSHIPQVQSCQLQRCRPPLVPRLAKTSRKRVSLPDDADHSFPCIGKVQFLFTPSPIFRSRWDICRLTALRRSKSLVSFPCLLMETDSIA